MEAKANNLMEAYLKPENPGLTALNSQEELCHSLHLLLLSRDMCQTDSFQTEVKNA